MSKVDEVIKQIEEALSREYDRPGPTWEFNAFLKNLKEIRTEQEELQKKADKYDELKKHLEFTVKSYEEQQAILHEQSKPMTEKLDKLLKEIENPEKFNQFIEDYHAFVDQSDAEWDEDDVILIMTEFHDEYLVDSENSVEIGIKYAHKLIDLFQSGVAAEIERQSKPVEIPQFVADFIVSAKPTFFLGQIFRLAYNYENNNDRFDNWLARGNNHNIFASAWVNNYTVKQEPLYYVKVGNMHFVDWGEDNTQPRFNLGNIIGEERDWMKMEKEVAQDVAEMIGGEIVPVDEK